MVAQLVITGPAPLRGTSFSLSGARMIIGRGAGSDVRIEDSFISEYHAVVVQRGGHAMLEDLGSTNGTTINGQVVSTSVALHHGDVIRFGRVEIRFEEKTGNERWDGTGRFDAAQDRDNRRDNAVNFTVGRQDADMLNNIGGDQYIHQSIHERDGFLRDIAATKTKATRLIWFGFLLIVLGGAAFASMVLGFISEIWSKLPSAGNPGDVPPDLSSPTLGGVPIGLLGWAAAAIGSVLVIIGIVLHVVATARRRRVEAAYPIPPTYRPRRSP